MKSINGNSQARENKLSEQFVEFIDLTDENLEEVNIQGGWGGFGGGFGFSCESCFGFSCESCWSCESCFGFGFEFFSCGSCFF